jgi:hypothetical protein
VPNPHKRSIYLVTIWQERPASPDEPAVWRVSVEDARTGERRAFADLEQLQTFLESQMIYDELHEIPE